LGDFFRGGRGELITIEMYIVDALKPTGYSRSWGKWTQGGLAMRQIELTAGQVVQVGRYTLQVLAVYPDEVVIGLLDSDDDAELIGACDGNHTKEPWTVDEAL
jgi:hypothetical protein